MEISSISLIFAISLIGKVTSVVIIRIKVREILHNDKLKFGQCKAGIRDLGSGEYTRYNVDPIMQLIHSHQW
jgi:hypothetical protein